MKKLFFLLALFLAACSPQVGPTAVNSDQFPSTVVSASALPFSVTLPAGWTVREEPLVFTLAYDDGASGYIQIAKTPVDGPVGCSTAAGKEYCVMASGELRYSVVLTDKSMSAARRAEAEAILGSVK